MVVRKYLGAFKGMCTSYGIAHSTTTPYTPELNGKAERYWRTVMGTASAFLKYDGDLTVAVCSGICQLYSQQNNIGNNQRSSQNII